MPRRKPTSLIGFFIFILLFLVAVFYTLFQPSFPTSSEPIPIKSLVIPLDNQNLSAPGDLQRGAGGLQPARPMTSLDLRKLDL